MNETWVGFAGSILVALITYLGVVRTAREQNAATMEQLKAQSAASDAMLRQAQAVTDAKLDMLTAEVRKHNDFASRVPILEEKISVANHRIDDLEKRQAG